MKYLFLVSFTSLALLANQNPGHAQGTYRIKGTALSDTYQATVTFNGAAQSVSTNVEVSERLVAYHGHGAGMETTDAGGYPYTIKSWKQKGVIAEFIVKTKNGSYIASNEDITIPSSLEISDFDLQNFSNKKLRILGLYADLGPLNYEFDNSLLDSSQPVGIGPHPLGEPRSVIYAQIEEHELKENGHVFPGIIFDNQGSKYRLRVSTAGFNGIPLGAMLYVLGIRNPFTVNEVRVGMLLGLAADATGDGKVDGADSAVWKANYGRVGGRIYNGDFNDDAYVDGSDLLEFQRQMGANITGIASVALEVPAVTAASAPAPESEVGAGVIAPEPPPVVEDSEPAADIILQSSPPSLKKKAGNKNKNKGKGKGKGKNKGNKNSNKNKPAKK